MTTEQHAKWVRGLETAHYDIIRQDPLQGHKEHGSHTAVDVYVDDSGQIRMVYTRLLDTPKGEEKKSRSGREYQVFHDRTYVTLVNYKLRDEDSLADVLREIEKEILD
jgi:hypothetical protein